MSIKLRTASDGLVILQPEDTASEVTVTVPAGTSDLVSTDTLRTELNATGTAPIYACRAWVNFNGTGTVAIRASGNVSSITDNGTGDYTVNFTTAMPDANYSCVLGCLIAAGSAFPFTVGRNSARTDTTSSVNITTEYNGAFSDNSVVDVAIFR